MIDPVSISWPERVRRVECAVVIPTYNHAGTLAEVIAGVKRYCADIFVVNDGSTDMTAQLLATIPDIRIIAYPHNRGKGYALRTGLLAAAAAGFRYAITIDSDGQHYPEDIPAFIERIEAFPDRLLVGARNLTAENMPSKNTFANRFSNFWYKVETGHTLQDTQSGFRLYPLRKLGRMRTLCRRYEFEVEILVRAAMRGVVSIIRPKENVSPIFVRSAILPVSACSIRSWYCKLYLFIIHGDLSGHSPAKISAISSDVTLPIRPRAICAWLQPWGGASFVASSRFGDTR